MRLSVVIQAHPARREHAEAVRTAAGGRIIYDPQPDGPRDTWRSNRACWAHDPHGDWTHRLLLQDDVICCPGFRRAARNAIAAQPDQAVALFCQQQHGVALPRIQAAAATGQRWALLERVELWCPMQALCLPRALVERMLAWTRAHHHPGHAAPAPWLRPGARRSVSQRDVQQRLVNDDEIIGRWMRECRVPLLISVPSLVEHDVWTPSLIANDRFAGRRAACLVGDECDAATIAWS